MPHRATQPIASAFGSYMPGDQIDEAAEPVIEAWVAAGIAEPITPEPTAADRSDEIEHALYGTDDYSEETPVDPRPIETATAPKPEPATAPKPIETATAPKPERAVSRRMQTEPTAHRRFARNADKE